MTPSPEPQTVTKTIQIQNETFAYDYFFVKNKQQVLLLANFTHPKDFKSLIQDNKCDSAVNGGFYDTKQKPLGYFQTNSKVIGKEIRSDLVNGFIWSEASSSAVISSELPKVPHQFALQTGPMLLFNGNILPLSVHNDKHARRMIAVKTMDNQTLFMTVYKEDSVFEGPLLTDLPDIIGAISKKESLSVADAINLDGGSASAFYNGTTSLSELTSVGSVFCVH